MQKDLFMVLPVKPKPRVQVPAQDLEFSASPYIGNELWSDGLSMMHEWMASYFEVGDVFADYVFAKELKVHRCIADLWLACLKGAGHIEAVPIERGHNREIYAPGFIVCPATGRAVNLKVPKELREFDPWEDRSLDNEVPDAKFADYYIDKYFDIFVNEYYFYTGYFRKRDNGKTFQPIDHAEHPRHATKTGQAHGISQAPAPIEWRPIIERLCEI